MRKASPEKIADQYLSAATPKTTRPVNMEVTVKAAMRNYKEDPAAPVHTMNLLPETVGWARMTFPDSKTAAKQTADFVSDIQAKWDKGLGQNYKGSFQVRAPNATSGGGATKSKDVIPDYYREATVMVEKITARGEHVITDQWKWEIGGTWTRR